MQVELTTCNTGEPKDKYHIGTARNRIVMGTGSGSGSKLVLRDRKLALGLRNGSALPNRDIPQNKPTKTVRTTRTNYTKYSFLTLLLFITKYSSRQCGQLYWRS